jgi:hypothetical protein
MFPFCFEWVWDMSHMVFMGGLWYALSIIGAGMTFCIAKTILDTLNSDESSHHH